MAVRHILRGTYASVCFLEKWQHCTPMTRLPTWGCWSTSCSLQDILQHRVCLEQDQVSRRLPLSSLAP